jgi:hypothetical protein
VIVAPPDCDGADMDSPITHEPTRQARLMLQSEFGAW